MRHFRCATAELFDGRKQTSLICAPLQLFTLNNICAQAAFICFSALPHLRSITAELFEGGKAEAALLTVKCLPAIIIAMFALRWLLMTVEAPLLSLVGPRLTWQEVAFSALGGLRGGLALILAQTVLASHGATKDPQLKVNDAVWSVIRMLPACYEWLCNKCGAKPCGALFELAEVV